MASTVRRACEPLAATVLSRCRTSSATASCPSPPPHPPASASIRQHTSAYVSIQHTSDYIAYISIRQLRHSYMHSGSERARAHSRPSSIRQHTTAYVSIREHTSAYVRGVENDHADGGWPRGRCRHTLAPAVPSQAPQPVTHTSA